MDLAHFRPLRSRRFDPKHVSRRREPGSITPPTRPCGFSTRSIATSNGHDDRTTLKAFCCQLDRHRRASFRGTKFNIHVDLSDGLLCQGKEGYQLTWMDAKMGDWVVTPRRGKAVEINALWYNALKILVSWLRGRGRTTPLRATIGMPNSARASFNDRFWY